MKPLPRQKKKCSWMNDNIKALIRERDAMARKLKKSANTNSLQELRNSKYSKKRLRVIFVGRLRILEQGC